MRMNRRGIWTITDGKAGMDVQALGVAHALGLPVETKHVQPKGIFKLAAPWFPADPRERIGVQGALLGPPWPACAIATGRQSIPYLRAVRRHAGRETVTVVLQDPKTGPGTADLIWVPEHDRLRGPNVISTLTAPSSFTPGRLAELRSKTPGAISALPRPRIAVMLGGDNGVYKFTANDLKRMAGILKSLTESGASLMISPSRRTPPNLIEAVDIATRHAHRLLWTGESPNPYADFLAHADALLVTGDSVNMVSEACATGRPVHVFHPSGGSPKFNRFHRNLENYGACRPLPDRVSRWETWTYKPLCASIAIAEEIKSRWPELCPTPH